jgi:L-ornithine N5-oxygenase
VEEIELLAADAVVLATGYTRNMHVQMLKQCQMLNGNANGEWTIGRKYGVQLNPDVAGDIGIWLQGCNESTHGLSDSLLSILATRSGELVESVFGERLSQQNGSK